MLVGKLVQVKVDKKENLLKSKVKTIVYMVLNDMALAMKKYTHK